MAKIKVVSIPEMIEVNNEELKEFVARREARQISNDELVSFGTWGGTAGQIKSWILDEDKKPDPRTEEMKKGFLEYLESRKRKLSLQPKERAEENFEYIALIYYVFTDRHLETEPPAVKKELLELAVKWFEFNPEWSLPSLLAFKGYLKTDKKIKNNFQAVLFQSMLNLFERQENSEKKAQEFDQKETEQYELTAEGLPYPVSGAEEPAF